MLKILNKKLFLFFLLLASCYGCTPFVNKFGITSTSGVYIHEDKLKKILPGMYQTEVFNILGTPTFTSDFDKNKWFYINQQTWYIATLKEKLIKQQILILSFNDDGRLNTIVHKDLSNTSDIPFDNSSNTKFYYQKNYIKPDLF